MDEQTTFDNHNNPYVEEVQFALLTYIIRASSYRNRQGRAFLKELGIDETMISMLASLPVGEFRRLAELMPFDIRFKGSVMSSTISRLDIRDREQRHLRRLIELGISRQAAYELYQVNVKQFRQIRRELNMDESNNTKPSVLTDDQLLELSKRHDDLIRFERHVSKLFSVAELLIKMTEMTSIDINQIFIYYYKENKDLFDKRRLFISKPKNNYG